VTGAGARTDDGRSTVTTVDLRSDTLTRPTPGMRTAMADAEVGDDVYGEDPTVNALEAEVAAAFGHEAALFVPTGTMANQVAVALLVEPGHELVCDADAHVVTYEMGASAALSGVTTRTVPSELGALDPDTIARALRPPGFHTVVTAAVAVENTHNRGGGTVLDMADLLAVHRVTADAGVALHCDGARIWNAHVATGVELAAYGALFDTLAVCLSKGLGAPVGSLVVSSAERVARGRVLRKRLGGGMRQAGVLAAAGRYALAHHLDRLADDHARARRLAEALAPTGAVDPARVHTNVVLMTVPDAAAVVSAAATAGVRLSAVGPTTLRAVTHLDVDDDGITRAVEVLGELVRPLPG
jgi:threonine aldolase